MLSYGKRDKDILFIPSTFGAHLFVLISCLERVAVPNNTSLSSPPRQIMDLDTSTLLQHEEDTEQDVMDDAERLTGTATALIALGAAAVEAQTKQVVPLPRAAHEESHGTAPWQVLYASQSDRAYIVYSRLNGGEVSKSRRFEGNRSNSPTGMRQL
ncbi:hypothetical protein C8J57DRAFT_1510650 [Mycena rebaudengoi]|nr:hypothetical protein C8J57DRAFT_1510650 [Mycena rebaudengoi]